MWLSSTDEPFARRPALLRDDTLARCDNSLGLALKILLSDEGTSVGGAPSSSLTEEELGLAEASSSSSLWRCCPSSSSSFSGRSVRVAASSPSSGIGGNGVGD